MRERPFLAAPVLALGPAGAPVPGAASASAAVGSVCTRITPI